MKHRNNFDFIRLFAAGLVLVSHQFALQGYDEPQVFHGTIGGLGVCIFFTISGYLVSQSWARSPQLVSFARKRLTRIWPGLAGVTLFCALILGPVVTTLPLSDYFASPVTREYVFSQLLLQIRPMLPGVFEHGVQLAINGSLWSIPLELKWYVILGVLGFAGLAKRTSAMAGLAVIVVAYNFARAAEGGPPNQLAAFGAYFAIGATLSTVRDWLLRNQRSILVVTALAAGVYVASDQGLLALSFLLPAATVIVGEGSSPIARSAGRYGDFSYGFYLYAWPVQKTVLWLTDGRITVPLAMAISAVVTLGFAYLSWTLIEGPAMRAIKRSARPVAQRGQELTAPLPPSG